MLWIATAAAFAANAPVPETAARPQRQAQAVVRILRPALIRFGKGSTGSAQSGEVRETQIQDSAGEQRRAILVEFS